MKNTRLYFDKDFKPITKLTLSLRMPGATPNFETDMDIIAKGNATGVADIPTWIGTTRKVCESQAGVAFDDILATPSLLVDQNNSTESDFDVFLRAEQDTTLAGLEPLDGPIHPTLSTKYQEFVASKDIDYKLVSIDSIEVTDCVGNPVDVLTPDLDPAPGFILKMDVKGTPYSFATDGYIYFESSLEKILGSKYNLIIDKWFKIKITYTAGIELTEKAKVYFETDEFSELKQRTATYYLVNTAYLIWEISANIFGQTGYATSLAADLTGDIAVLYSSGKGVIKNYKNTPPLLDIVEGTATIDNDELYVFHPDTDSKGEYLSCSDILGFPILPEAREVFNDNSVTNYIGGDATYSIWVHTLIKNIVAVDSEGTSVILDNFDFIKITDKFTNPLTYPTNYPLSSLFYYKDSAIHYPNNYKWVKFTVTAKIGIEPNPNLVGGSKISNAYNLQYVEPADVTFSFYMINENYKEPAIYINVTGDSGAFYMENVDIITNVHHANLSKQADGTWTLDFSYDLKDGVIEMLGVRNTITGITNDAIKQNSLIYTDTTYGPKPVTFRVWEIN